MVKWQHSSAFVAGIPCRIWDLQGEKEEEKEMGKFLMAWCGSDLDILFGLLYGREAGLSF